MNKIVERETLTVKEAAVLFGIGRNQVYEAVKKGKIPSIRFGRKILLPRIQIAQMLQSTITEKEVLDAEGK